MQLTFNDDSFIKQMRVIEGFTESQYSDEYLRGYFAFNERLENDTNSNFAYDECVDELRYDVYQYTLKEFNQEYQQDCEDMTDAIRILKRMDVRYFTTENLICIVRS